MAQIFPKWWNQTPGLALFGTVVGGGAATFGLYWWGSPWHTDVGYKPRQPVEYSHKLHAGDMAIDCRYCHAYVERGPHAGVPSTQTCMNCHSQVKKAVGTTTDSTKLLPCSSRGRPASRSSGCAFTRRPTSPTSTTGPHQRRR